jgi:hypothetical protein
MIRYERRRQRGGIAGGGGKLGIREEEKERAHKDWRKGMKGIRWG